MRRGRVCGERKRIKVEAEGEEGKHDSEEKKQQKMGDILTIIVLWRNFCDFLSFIGLYLQETKCLYLSVTADTVYHRLKCLLIDC
jgi:negative regulator of genetic competence, sporulation and motility